MNKIFEGVGVALVTPFIEGKIDYLSMGNLIDRCISHGIDAIIVLGTTGEGSTISSKERKKIITYAYEKIRHRAKLIVGTGHNNFKTCLENTKMAKDLGADGCLVVTPYYNKTTQEGIIKYYEMLSQVKLPIIIYNVPSRTGLNIELNTVKKLIDTCPYVYGIKESTTDIDRIMKLHLICKDKIAIYSGEDQLNHIFYFLGASGCISVTANIFPKEVKSIYKASTMSSMVSQQNQLQDINHALFLETNPTPIKTLLKNKGFIRSQEARLPLVEMTEKNLNTLNSISQDYIYNY